MGRWTIVNALLAAIVALLSFEIVRTWGRGLPPVDVPPSAGPPPAAAAPHEKGGKRAADKAAARAQQTPPVLVAAIVDKDLFDPSRRPPTPDEVKVESQAPITKPPDNVTVVGVRILGKDREVFVTDATQTPAAGRRLRAGDQVAGYTVKKIEATAVVLSSPSGDIVSMPLTLDKGKAATGPRPGIPGKPGPQTPVPVRPAPVPPTPAVSPAAGPRGASPAAGVQPPPPPPTAPAVPVPAPAVAPAPAQTPQAQQLGTEARQKLDQLRQMEKRPGRKR
jgi:hypothetical protein